MYRDVFDHKGPLLYLINWAGTLVGPESGVWVFEIASFFLTSYFVYSTLRRYASSVLSLLGMACILLLLNNYFYGGNNPEEYALPFTTCSLMVFNDYFLEKEISKRKLFSCGFCWMSVMMIRPNMIGVWIVFALAVLIQEVSWKTNRTTFFLRWFLLGAFAVLIPIVIYLQVHSAFNDFWEQYILFNMVYTAAEGKNSSIMMLYYFRQPVIAIAILICILSASIDRKRRFLSVTSLLFIIVTVALTSMSGRSYAHYGISLMPVYVLPFAFLLRLSEMCLHREYIQTGCVSVLLLVLLVPWAQYVRNLPNYRPAYLSAENYLSSIIAENTRPTDKIISCGNDDLFYLYSDRMAASKYSYQLPIAEANPAIYDDFMKDIAENTPEVIVTSTNTVNGILYLDEINRRIGAFIEENEYHHWASAEGFSVYGRKPIADIQ